MEKIPVPPYNKVKKMPIKELNEPLINILLLSPRIVSGMSKKRMQLQNLTKPLLLARKSVGEKLLQAIKLLDKKFCLMIFDAHRPLEVQKMWFLQEVKLLQQKNPSLTKNQCINAVNKWLSPGNLNPPSPHSTGGAIDLTLAKITRKGETSPLEMGSNHTEWSPKSWSFSENISLPAKQNRQLLFSTMKKIGLQNFEGEWWHFSFGDQDWAVRTNSLQSIFGPVAVNPKNRSFTIIQTNINGNFI